MKQPSDLNQIKMDTVFDEPGIVVEINYNQWNPFLQSAYDAGYRILEVNKNGKPYRAYRKG